VQVVMALHEAAAVGDVERIQTLVQQGQRVDATNEDEDTPLHHAALKGQVEAVKALVALGADVQATGAHGATPLHSAAFNGQVEAVKALVALGADMQAKDDEGNTPLQLCRQQGHTEVELVLSSQPTRSRRKGKAPVTRECTAEAIAHAQRMGDALIEEEERAKAKAAKSKVSWVGAERCGGVRCE
jgi:ankyrin repeat protein